MSTISPNSPQQLRTTTDGDVVTACLVCGKPNRHAGERWDDRYGYPGTYSLLRCDACGHCTLSAALTPEQITELYTRYYPRSSFDVEAWQPPRDEPAWRTWWQGLRSSAFRWVPRNVRVLDIGCGFGESLGYHRARGCDAHGVEADHNILRVAERHGLKVRFGLFDPAAYQPGSFDVVTLDQVIEHIAQPESVLRGVHRVLKPAGMLVLSTPNVDGWGARVFGRRWIHWHAPYHVQFFSRRSMAMLAQRCGFVVEQRATVTHSAWLGFQWYHLVTYPNTGQPSAFWASSVRRTVGQRTALRLLRLLDQIGLNVVLTRLMDTLGAGDNVVHVLRKRAT